MKHKWKHRLGQSGHRGARIVIHGETCVKSVFRSRVLLYLIITNTSISRRCTEKRFHSPTRWMRSKFDTRDTATVTPLRVQPPGVTRQANLGGRNRVGHPSLSSGVLEKQEPTDWSAAIAASQVALS